MSSEPNLVERTTGRVIALLVVFFVAVAAAAAWSAPAQAHASLVASVPENGTIVQEPPSRIELRFSEPVSPLAASLIEMGGEAREIDDLSASGSLLLIVLPPMEGDGTRVVSWRAVSADGHPISGAVVFSIGAPSEGNVEEALDTDPGTARLLWAVRALMFVALFFGTGGAAFRIIASPLPRTASLLCAAIIPVGLLASISVIGLQGLDALGLPLSRIADAHVWSVGFSTSYGGTSLVAGLALLLGGAAVFIRRDRYAVVVSAIGLAMVGLAVCLSGHASTAEPQWLMRSALFVHVACIAWWVGALFPLALLLKSERDVSAPPLIRFSRIIPFAIVPLLVSGAVLAVVQLGWPGPGWTSPYGVILAGKLVLVAVLFGLASWNRWVLTAPAAAGDVAARTHMRWSILGEMILVIVILGLASGWRFTPPPRSIASIEELKTSTLALQADGVTAELTIAPPGHAPRGAIISLHQTGGSPLAARSVVLSLAEPELGIQAIKSNAELTEEGTWSIEHLLIPVSGQWEVEIQVRVSDFKLVHLKGDMEVAP